MLQFSWFAFLSTFRLSNQTSKIARILTLYQANAATFTPLSKEDKILITSLQECKGYNARQFITEFMNRGWTKTASTGCGWSSEQSTGVWAAADAVRILMKMSTVELLLLSQEDKPQSHRTIREISRKAGDPIDHLFRRLFTKFCVSSATRKGALNSWLKWIACTRYFWYAVWETITW